MKKCMFFLPFIFCLCCQKTDPEEFMTRSAEDSSPDTSGQGGKPTLVIDSTTVIIEDTIWVDL